MLSDKARARIETALKKQKGVDWTQVETDRLYRELFPDEVPLHEFRTVCEAKRAEQLKQSGK